MMIPRNYSKELYMRFEGSCANSISYSVFYVSQNLLDMTMKLRGGKAKAQSRAKIDLVARDDHD